MLHKRLKKKQFQTRFDKYTFIACLCHRLMQQHSESACSQLLIQVFTHPTPRKRSSLLETLSSRRSAHQHTQNVSPHVILQFLCLC